MTISVPMVWRGRRYTVRLRPNATGMTPLRSIEPELNGWVSFWTRIYLCDLAEVEALSVPDYPKMEAASMAWLGT